MKTLLLRNSNNKPYTVLIKGVFRKRYYLVSDEYGLIELPKVVYKEPS